jgi:hypothetical protein
MAAHDSKLLLAFVALNSPRVPTPEQVISLLRDKYTSDPVPTAGSAGDPSVFFDLPDGTAVFALMPAPIPWGDLEGPCQTAFWWPEAEAVLRKHTHHFIVSLMTEVGTPLERHVWLTKFIAALVESSDAAGVYWGTGTVVHPPGMFCEQAERAAADNPVPQLWIDLRCWPEGRGFRFATTGMYAFGIPEVEVDHATWPPGELYDFCANVVAYILRRGSAIPDGESIGRSATEKIKIRHAPSMWERDGPVMKLVMS